MEPDYYIKKFKLDQENFEFSREDFLKELNEDLLDYIQTTHIGKDPTGHLNYYRFKEIVYNFQQKFNAISKLKVGSPLSKKLWNAFYAIYIIPLRAELFPIIHGELQKFRNNKIQTSQDKKYTGPKNKGHGKRNP